MLLPYLPPPKHCSLKQYTPQPNTTPLQPLRRHEEKHTPTRCVLHYLPETNIRVSFNNQPSRSTRRRTTASEEEEGVGPKTRCNHGVRISTSGHGGNLAYLENLKNPPCKARGEFDLANFKAGWVSPCSNHVVFSPALAQRKRVGHGGKFVIS